MTFEIRPLSDALGAEVLGGNFKAALAVGEIDELKSAFLDIICCVCGASHCHHRRFFRWLATSAHHLWKPLVRTGLEMCPKSRGSNPPIRRRRQNLKTRSSAVDRAGIRIIRLRNLRPRLLCYTATRFRLRRGKLGSATPERPMTICPRQPNSN